MRRLREWTGDLRLSTGVSACKDEVRPTGLSLSPTRAGGFCTGRPGFQSRRRLALLCLLLTTPVVPALARAARGPAVASPPAPATAQPRHSIGYRRMLSFPRRPVQLRVPKLGRDVERLALKNGMVLFLMEEHRLPIVRISAIIRAGSSFVPRDQEIAMSMLGGQIRQGGTTSRSFEQLNDELEFMGASLETSTGSEQSGAGLDVLSRDVDRGVKLFADVLMHPAFDPRQLEIAKGLAVEGIRRRNDEPSSIVSRYFSRLLYTMDHPAGRAGFTTIADVENVSRDQLIALHRKYYGPNNIWLAVVGDFDRKQMIARLEDAFAGWEPVDAAAISQEKKQLPRASGKNQPGVYLIRRPLPQANIRIGEFGIDRINPDRFALAIMNQILGGGGFTSRLTARVRTDEGLAYSVGTAFDTGTRDLGTFRAALETKTASVGPAVRAVLEEVRRIREQPVSAQELERVKETFINTYIFRFESPLFNVVQLMQLEYDGRPSNYYETLLDKYRAVTREDVLRVARKYLQPDQLTFLVVGDVQEKDPVWSKLGRVTTLPLNDGAETGAAEKAPAVAGS
jgi:zinc protease